MCPPSAYRPCCASYSSPNVNTSDFRKSRPKFISPIRNPNTGAGFHAFIAGTRREELLTIIRGKEYLISCRRGTVTPCVRVQFETHQHCSLRFPSVVDKRWCHHSSER